MVQVSELPFVMLNLFVSHRSFTISAYLILLMQSSDIVACDEEEKSHQQTTAKNIG